VSSTLVIRKDKNGIPVDWVADVMAAYKTFELPEFWPADLEGCRAVLYDCASIQGAAVAMGWQTLDEAYAWTRFLCVRAQEGTMARAHVQATFPGCTDFIDNAAARVGMRLAIADHKAERVLRGVGIAAINGGKTTAGVRNAIGQAAERMNPKPPFAVLSEAFNAAATECRMTARWMTMREKATA
jgi:hypothetical protein